MNQAKWIFYLVYQAIIGLVFFLVFMENQEAGFSLGSFFFAFFGALCALMPSFLMTGFALFFTLRKLPEIQEKEWFQAILHWVFYGGFPGLILLFQDESNLILYWLGLVTIGVISFFGASKFLNQPGRN